MEPADLPLPARRPLNVYECTPEQEAEIRRLIRENARRRAGAGGAALAGVMLALKEIYQSIPPEEQITVVFEADGEPYDLDVDGFRYTVGEAEAVSQPPERPFPDDRRR